MFLYARIVRPKQKKDQWTFCISEEEEKQWIAELFQQSPKIGFYEYNEISVILITAVSTVEELHVWCSGGRELEITMYI